MTTPNISPEIVSAQEAVYQTCLEKWGAENSVTIDALAVLYYLKVTLSTSPRTDKDQIQKNKAALLAQMAAQHYCRGLWGAARGHGDWRKVHEAFVAGYSQGRHDELQAQGPSQSVWDKYAPVQREGKS